MSDVQRGEATERPFARFGLSRATLEAAILAELDENGDGGDSRAIAAAVASAIEANNQELLRHLSEMLTSDTMSAQAIRAKLPPEDES